MRRDKILNFCYKILIKKVAENYWSRDFKMTLRKILAKSVKRFLRISNVHFWAVWCVPWLPLASITTWPISRCAKLWPNWTKRSSKNRKKKINCLTNQSPRFFGKLMRSKSKREKVRRKNPPRFHPIPERDRRREANMTTNLWNCK